MRPAVRRPPRARWTRARGRAPAAARAAATARRGRGDRRRSRTAPTPRPPLPRARVSRRAPAPARPAAPPTRRPWQAARPGRHPLRARGRASAGPLPPSPARPRRRSARRAPRATATARRTAIRPAAAPRDARWRTRSALFPVEHAKQRRHHRLVERVPGLRGQARAHRVARERRTIGARRGERVEDVGHGDDARLERDGLPGQSVGIAGAVPALVVMSDHARDGGEELEGVDDLRADDGIVVYVLALLRRPRLP